MPVGGRKVPPTAVEFDVVTVKSTISDRTTELTASWNRMFEPRVITDTGPDRFTGPQPAGRGGVAGMVLRLREMRAGLPGRPGR